MSNNSEDRRSNQIQHRAYIRDGNIVHTGEAVLLACVKAIQGKSRKSEALQEVQRLMRDRNVTK